MLFQPCQNVICQSAIVRASFDNVERRYWFSSFGDLRQPFSELPSEELSKQRTHRGAGVEFTLAANDVSFLFIESINRTIERLFHERREGDHAAKMYFMADFFS